MKTHLKQILEQDTTTARGFTLVETLIAIVILTLSIVGPFQIVQGVLDSAYNARDELIGTGLAQEGMEYIREVRDSNYLNNAKNNGGISWLSGFDGTSGTPNCLSNTCMMDPMSNNVYQCTGTTCSYGPLYLDTNYVYNQQQRGVATKFVRSVTMTTISANETLVTVTVTWVNHGTRSVVLKEYFRNWL